MPCTGRWVQRSPSDKAIYALRWPERSRRSSDTPVVPNGLSPPPAFAILEFGKDFVIPVKAPFTQDAESAAKHIHFNGLRRARAVNCCAAERTSCELARAAVKVQNSSTFAAARCDVSRARQ